ncbi:alkylation response protein AidB-like acyl-CoA dehydrogenase [Bacillus ectoiniformans]|uniref:acyl-CoA dehydrogenase family protein n=1 Tax=Bacillus ectoiniformans TaxID=1494429 RepID=UPI00195DD075|nr:acyl-CoA dehydrogenase family protein [Bacillus ectoiniformans]MBM7650444.1 alkylation response protein AidB-like acyl-CoA dehydrogenase [Bacillus ectoiniformans]
MNRENDTYNLVLNQLKGMEQQFQEREYLLDELNSFPFDNMNDLKSMNYTTLTLPKEFGEAGVSLSEFLRFQEQIAKGCGSTALSIGWHMGMILEFSEHRHWNKALVPLLTKAIKEGHLINAASSERNAGSPLRGAAFSTRAERSADGKSYQVTGVKTFTSMSPMLDFFFVTASIEEKTAVLLIPRDTPGVSIKETWDSVAMRGTASHDLVLDAAEIPSDYIIEYINEESKKRRKGWMLHIPVCYLGIAGAARDYAVRFAASYTPSSLDHPIGKLPNVQQLIGEIEMKLISSRQFLYRVAEEYDRLPNEDFKTEMAAVKTFVTNQAIEVVDLSMRIVGARSLSEKNPLRRYYQNVRAGLHNPPMDDITLKMLADQAIKECQHTSI